MRVLCWNVNGDTSTGQNKVEEINGIIKCWENVEIPEEKIQIICLQEVSENSSICDYLMSIGFMVIKAPENVNGGGRYSVIAIREDAGLNIASIYVENQEVAEKTIHNLETVSISGIGIMNGCSQPESSPTRAPLGVAVTGQGFQFYIFTYHATLGSRAHESLERFDNFLNTLVDAPILLAGDLNIDVVPVTTPEEFNGNIEQFEGFDGYNNHLDYILGRGILVVEACSNDDSWSDHVPMSAKIVMA